MLKPELVLPEDPTVRARLEKKLSKYRERLVKDKQNVDSNDAFKSPEEKYYDLSDTLYKIAVAEAVLSGQPVDTQALARQLETQDIAEGRVFNLDLFNNACIVIKDYTTTGGLNNIGGGKF